MSVEVCSGSMKVDDPGLADRPAATRAEHTQHPPGPPRVRAVPVADGAWVSGTDRGAGAGTARMRICALAPSVPLTVVLATTWLLVALYLACRQAFVHPVRVRPVSLSGSRHCVICVHRGPNPFPDRRPPILPYRRISFHFWRINGSNGLQYRYLVHKMVRRAHPARLAVHFWWRRC